MEVNLRKAICYMCPSIGNVWHPTREKIRKMHEAENSLLSGRESELNYFKIVAIATYLSVLSSVPAYWSSKDSKNMENIPNMTMGTMMWLFVVVWFCRGNDRAFTFMNKYIRNAAASPRTANFAEFQPMYDGPSSPMSFLSSAVAAQ